MSMKVRYKRGDSFDGPMTNLDDQAAVQLLLAGAAILDTHQPNPPFALLAVLEEQALDGDVFGQPAALPTLLSRFSEAALPNGIRQTMIKGKILRWYFGYKELRRAAETSASLRVSSETSLFDQARSVLKTYIADRSVTLTSVSHLPNDERREKFLIGGRLANIIQRIYGYRRLAPDWFEYYERFENLDKKLERTIHDALMAGQILCCEETELRARLIHPEQTANLKIKSAKSSYSFCFSSDLPTEWFGKEVMLHKKRNEATEWMIRVFGHFHGLGRRVSSEQLIEIAMGKYTLSRNAAEDAWKKARVKLDVPGGRIPDELRVNTSEIKEIK